MSASRDLRVMRQHANSSQVEEDPGSRLLLLEKFVFLVLGFDAEKNGEVGTKGGVVGLVSFSTVNGFPRLGYFRLGLLLDEPSILC